MIGGTRPICPLKIKITEGKGPSPGRNHANIIARVSGRSLAESPPFDGFLVRIKY